MSKPIPRVICLNKPPSRIMSQLHDGRLLMTHYFAISRLDTKQFSSRWEIQSTSIPRAIKIIIS